MPSLRSVLMRGGLPAGIMLLAAVTDARDAAACGGCFHGPTDVGGSIVTDHRMVFEITAKETILWDQVRYAGNPDEFAWVLPVRAGATIELSRGEWIAAVDAATRSTVQGPQIVCPPRPRTASTSNRSSSSSSSSSSSGGGCGGGGSTGFSATPETAGSAGTGNNDDGSSSGGVSPTFAGSDDVEVVAQSSIGPYQAVTIRASGTTGGISDWLKTNGFAIPESIAPVIDGYTAEKFDFIALKLRPGQGVQAMRPVRIASPGADPTMPLRMVAAGIGAKVGLTLWVIGEGRYRTQNFPDAPVDWPALSWDVGQRRSNRMELETAALATNGGRSWITEAALRTSVSESSYGNPTLPNVYDAYRTQCLGKPRRSVPCDEAALPPPDGQPDPDADGGAPDGGGEVGDDAGVDAGSDASTCTKVVSGCDGFDDLSVAARSIHTGDVWITRLRADLPVSALTTDLKLEAAPDQSVLSPTFSTKIFNPPYDPCAATTPAPQQASPARTYTGNDDGCSCRTVPQRSDFGTWLIIGLTMVVLPVLARRKRS